MELTDEKKAHLLHAAATPGTVWYAACESGHIFWAGPNRDGYDEAAKDATEHDKTVTPELGMQ